jgi:ATP-binding cassette subfamily B protein
VSSALGSLFLLTVMGIGGLRVIHGAMTTPDLIAFILYSEMITGPFVALASLVPELAKARTAYGRIRRLFEDAPEVGRSVAAGEEGDAPINEKGKPERRLAGTVDFSHVSFAYRPETPVLEDVSFRANPGELVALVGPSGAGKSTIFRLLPRLYESGSGSITIGGEDASVVPVEALRSSIGLVSQDPFLFDMTVEENIRCGNPDASFDEVTQAAMRAHAAEFIERLPEGYSTTVGEGGSQLSGGQRQRIAIARAFLKDPSVLLLDEATSALDGRSERIVEEAIQDLAEGRTTIVIAHRLETIRNADKIIVVDHGRIVDEGPHEALIERCSLYQALYRSAEREMPSSDVAAAGDRRSGNGDERRRLRPRRLTDQTGLARPV